MGFKISPKISALKVSKKCPIIKVLDNQINMLIQYELKKGE